MLSEVVPSTLCYAFQSCAFCTMLISLKLYPLHNVTLFKLCPVHNIKLSKVVPSAQCYNLKSCALCIMLPRGLALVLSSMPHLKACVTYNSFSLCFLFPNCSLPHFILLSFLQFPFFPTSFFPASPSFLSSNFFHPIPFFLASSSFLFSQLLSSSFGAEHLQQSGRVPFSKKGWGGGEYQPAEPFWIRI